MRKSIRKLEIDELENKNILLIKAVVIININ